MRKSVIARAVPVALLAGLLLAPLPASAAGAPVAHRTGAAGTAVAAGAPADVLAGSVRGTSVNASAHTQAEGVSKDSKKNKSKKKKKGFLGKLGTAALVVGVLVVLLIVAAVIAVVVLASRRRRRG
ncbi:hypothetical protein [Streptomyces sp. NPDC001594]|uniref:hypothetical protein n=1 Tax=Streptomyces sp. NPDC001594 TaxID=3364590 RepID=UPI003698C81F